MPASSLSKPIDYSSGTAGNFLFDATKAEFIADGVTLKLQEAPETFAQDFASDTDFTYDSALAVFSAGGVRQIDRTPATSVMHSKLSTKDLNWRKDGGSLTGTLIGAPTFSASGMVATGSQGAKWVRTTLAQETILVKYQPNYTGSPPANINIVSTSGVNTDRIQLTHSPSGDNFRITIYNSAGSLIALAQIIGGNAVNLSSAVIYHLALVVDAPAGLVRLYKKDGAGAWALHGTYNVGVAFTRGGISKDYIVGADAALYNQAEGEFSEFSHYSAILDPVASAPVDPLPLTIYAESKIDLPNFEFSGVGSIVSVDSASVTGANGPGYIVAGRYWNGSIWAVSDSSFAQSSPSADVIANIASFPATGLTIVPVSVAFGDSNLQMSVDDFSVVVTGTTAYPTTAQKIEENAGQLMDALENFEISSSVIPAGDSATFTLKWAGQEYYWDGSQVAASAGTVAQSNTAAVIATNTAAFTTALGIGAQVTVVMYLLSSNGLTTPKVEQVTLGYNFYNTQSDPPTTTAWGFIRDAGGVGVQDVVVTVVPYREVATVYREAGDSVIGKGISRTTDVNGRFEMDLVRASSYEGEARYQITAVGNGVNILHANDNEDPILFRVDDVVDQNITDKIISAP